MAGLLAVGLVALEVVDGRAHLVAGGLAGTDGVDRLPTLDKPANLRYTSRRDQSCQRPRRFRPCHGGPTPTCGFPARRQALGDSQRRQREFALRISAEEGALLDDSLTLDDLGVSAFRGRNAQVGALGQFLEAIETGRVSRGSILILESIDRLSAAVGQALQLFISILNHGVEIITAEPRRKYTSDSINDIASILEPLIYMSRAHEESKTKSMRIRAVWGQRMKAARADKRPAWGSVPAWIIRTPDGFRLDSNRAEVVRLIFRLAVEGMGARRIAQELNERGIPPQGTCKHWSLSYIKLILKSRSVYGEYQPGSRGEDGRRALPGQPDPRILPPGRLRIRLLGRPGRSSRPPEMHRPGRPKRGQPIHRHPTCGAERGDALRHFPDVRRPSLPLPDHARRTPLHPVPRSGRPYPRLPGPDAGARPRRTGQPADEAHALARQIDEETAKEFRLSDAIAKQEARLADPALDPAVQPSIERAIGELTRQKETVGKARRALKEKASASGLHETLTEYKELRKILRKAAPDERGPLRRRVKARVRNLLEEIWVLIQPIHKSCRIIHVVLYFRGGTRRYVRSVPALRRVVEPWHCANFDFRAGEIPDAATDALAVP